MASRTDAPAKCDLRSVFRFLQAEGLLTANDHCSCFLSDLTTTAKIHSDFWSFLIHDNAHPHSAVVTQQLLEQFKWDESVQPSYSPDLATSDFHLLTELKN
ncbi:hypothetical protein AVEN_129227-1 [Araneus ventricosus]|uniref:Mos1 transposase HTH domain-containing protein n=1 Tax=Araneus ventricosus TaxID=182803 RepID=A0A4Y2US58_ARAVE|nr:hypothetical protein AVEN_229303-1 [Araneus ventricosus]GBO15859.1 hypothetical protein AVEN_129227-1 [Araneus ventricosus]